jgi:hypothetical protein
MRERVERKVSILTLSDRARGNNVWGTRFWAPIYRMKEIGPCFGSFYVSWFRQTRNKKSKKIDFRGAKKNEERNIMS